MSSYTRDPIQEMRMHSRMKATKPRRAASMQEDEIETMLQASREAEENGLSDRFMDDWAEKSTALLSRLAGATHSLEMRMSGDGGHFGAIVQQESLEHIREAVGEEQMDHDELTVHTLAHMGHLAGRLEALVAEASQCQARLFCKCSFPQESKGWEFSVEDVLAKGRTIREYLSDHMRRAVAVNAEAPAADPQRTERQAMWTAHRELAGTFQCYITDPPSTMKGFTEKWLAMWSSEAFREHLNEKLVAGKERAEEKVMLKKVRHEKKWRELFKRAIEPTGIGAPSRPIFQSFRSWASARI